MKTKQMAFAKALLGVLIFSGCAGVPTMPTKDDERHVAVCLVNDQSALVSQETKIAAFARIAGEWRERVGVVFAIAEEHGYYEDAASEFPLPGIRLGMHLRNLCPKSEARFLFSNRTLFQTDSENFTYQPEESPQGVILEGYSNSYYGYLILPRADEQFSTIRNREPALLHVFRHELGHLFGLNDNLDSSGFMYPFLLSSQGKWTYYLTKTISSRKHAVRWFPDK